MDFQRILWIDTDIALGASRGDVDDGFALAAIFAAAKCSPLNIKIFGLSTVSGNTDQKTAKACLEGLMNTCSEYFGAAVESDLSSMSASIPTLGDGQWLIALGPLTNVAHSFREQKNCGSSLKLIWVGGVLSRFSIRRRLSDLNVKRDPQAAVFALANAENIYQFPLDVIDQMTIDAKRLKRIERTGLLGKYLATHSARWLQGAWLRHGISAFPVWDLVPALFVVGKLPSARFNDKQQLIGFNAEEAWNDFEGLLISSAALKI